MLCLYAPKGSDGSKRNCQPYTSAHYAHRNYQVGKKTVDKVWNTTFERNAWSIEQQLTDAYSKNVVCQVRERADNVYIKRDLWFCHCV